MSYSAATARAERAGPAGSPRPAPIDLIFFGHDANEPALRRRIDALSAGGARVTGFTMRRGAASETPWGNVDLGETHDQAYGQRLAAMFRAAPILLRERARLKAAAIFYARNLDMLALAVLAKALSGSKARIVYECLDVHRLMTREDPIGAGLRMAERALLSATSLLVVSAPAFLREYFERRHPGRYRAFIVENRLPASRGLGPRPSGQRMMLTGRPLVIGWFGNLRCARSFNLLRGLAEKYPDRVRIVMRGYPARGEIPDFDEKVKGLPNFLYHGRYKWPDDLARIYDEVDLVWAGDFHDPGANSRWLLPNRIYEGGYFGAPPIAPELSETGRWIGARGFGFTLPEPLERTLPDFIADLEQRAIARRREALLAAPLDDFVQPEQEMAALLAAALA